MIDLIDIHKSFGKTEVLKGVDISISRGEVVALIGSSGTGKTTLLRCINYLERPTAGLIRVAGTSVDAREHSKKDVLALRRKTAMVFQQYNLFKNKTVIQNVMEGLLVVQKKTEKEARAIAEEELVKVGLKDRLDAWPSVLSGGQQQRVGIARAMALKPEVILFDEPTSALDPELSIEVLSAIKTVAQTGITMIIVTHEMSFARRVASRVVYMDDGRIVEDGSPEQVFLHPKEARTRQFLEKIYQEFAYAI
jgi:L-cystine transport system ATP-binding protein